MSWRLSDLFWKPWYSLARLLLISSSSEASKAVCSGWADTRGNSSWAKGRFKPPLSPSHAQLFRANRLQAHKAGYSSMCWAFPASVGPCWGGGRAHTWPHCPSRGRRCFSVAGPAPKAAPRGVCPSSVLVAAKRPLWCRLEWATSAGGLRAEPLTPGWPAAPSFSRSASFSLQQRHSVQEAAAVSETTC